jgi:hypothetical protein
MKTISDILEAWPNREAFAADLGAKYATVSSWVLRKSIPADRWVEIVEHAARRGIPGVTFDVLARLHARPAPSQPDQEAA